MSQYASPAGILREYVKRIHNAPKARALVRPYFYLPVIIVELPDLIRAMEYADRYPWSFWDALIVTAAEKVRASILWTEDLPLANGWGILPFVIRFQPQRKPMVISGALKYTHVYYLTRAHTQSMTPERMRSENGPFCSPIYGRYNRLQPRMNR